MGDETSARDGHEAMHEALITLPEELWALIHGRLPTKSSPEFKTSTQNPKIAESALFPHISASISAVGSRTQNPGSHKGIGDECLAQ